MGEHILYSSIKMSMKIYPPNWNSHR